MDSHKRALQSVLAKMIMIPAISDVIFDWSREANLVSATAKASRECQIVDVPQKLNWDHLLKQLLPRLERREALQEYDDFAEFRLDDGKALRFRASLTSNLRGQALVLRLFPNRIPTPTELLIPEKVTKLFREVPDGLVLIVGGTGHGKTTSMVSLVTERCSRMSQNVITIEDPIEYLLAGSKMSRVCQRQVGLHTPSFAAGLKAALRGAPDVIMVGEIRDSESAAIALSAAMSGHLVVATLHSDFAFQGIQRLFSYVNEHGTGMEGGVGREIIAATLRCVVAQRLLKHDDQSALVPIHEVLMATTGVCSKIRAGEFKNLNVDLETGRSRGMMSFEVALLDRIREGRLPAGSRHMQLANG